MAHGEWTEVARATTDSAGQATVTKLRTGHYRLYETEAPEYLERRYTEASPYEFDIDTESPAQCGLALTVENAIRTVDVEAVKRWLNPDGTEDTGEHPTIWLQLKRKTGTDGRPVSVGNPVRLENGQPTGAWKDLPVCTVQGVEYIYFVIETDAEGQSWVPEGYSKEEDGLTVRNIKEANIETLDIPVTKLWEDADDQDGMRPASITVNLLANGEKVDSAEIKPDESGNWKHLFTGLPKYESSEEIVYSVTEDAVEGYSTSVEDFTITNQHTPETLDIPVTKLWDDADDQDGIRPASITVNLLANGEKVDSAEIKPDESGNWKHLFTGLPKYENGEEIVYAVTEEPVVGYDVSVGGRHRSSRGSI